MLWNYKKELEIKLWTHGDVLWKGIVQFYKLFESFNIFRMGHFFKKGKKFLFRSIIHKHKREEEEEEEEETDW